MTIWLEEMVRKVFSQDMVDSLKIIRQKLNSMYINRTDPQDELTQSCHEMNHDLGIQNSEENMTFSISDTESVAPNLGSIIDSGIDAITSPDRYNSSCHTFDQNFNDNFSPANSRNSSPES